MADFSQNDLQTLVATLQNTNIQLGFLIKAITGAPAALLANSTSTTGMNAYANDAAAAAGGVQLGGLYLNSTTYALTARHV